MKFGYVVYDILKAGHHHITMLRFTPIQLLKFMIFSKLNKSEEEWWKGGYVPLIHDKQSDENITTWRRRHDQKLE